jgi:NADH:ubiquinone oxidoreductase subunit F (NADH-binding)
MNLQEAIKEAGLVGRGGAEYPSWKKWEAVKKAEGKKKYVVCNASEGELGLFKDFHILKHYPRQVFEGMRLAMDFLGTKEGYINFNKEYLDQVRNQVTFTVRQFANKGYTLHIFEEEPSYIGGEETALLEAIEGKRTQPRMKPPYPSDSGLFGCPTLIHNVETLYNIALVAEEKYEHKRFYCLSENGKELGVFHYPDDWSIDQVLEEARCKPPFDYFMQIGGSVSGLVINKDQAKEQKMIGAGSIETYPASIGQHELLKRWFDFYAEESCGKCTPCRFGSYNLSHFAHDDRPVDWEGIMKIVEVMEATSFCALGRSVGVPVRSYRKNILKLEE